MKYTFTFLCLLLSFLSLKVSAQKPFAEGILIYKITAVTPGNQKISGTYTCTIKGKQVKKIIKLSNGYEDVLLFNCTANTVYSLQNNNGRKYAIQLNMDDFRAKQKNYEGFRISDEKGQEQIAGLKAIKATINYNNGNKYDLYYTKEWFPVNAITFEQFPNATILPLSYRYENAKSTMFFKAESVQEKPIENSEFRIPADYQMISYAEYKQLIK